MTQRAYHRLLKDVPAPLLVAGVDAFLETGPRFMPTAPELQVAAEKARRALLAAHPYDGCVECEGQRGFRTVIAEGGQPVVSPCPCKARHQQKLARLGLDKPAAVLPNEAGAGDEAVYPTLEQLPERIQARLRAVAAQKLLR